MDNKNSCDHTVLLHGDKLITFLEINEHINKEFPTLKSIEEKFPNLKVIDVTIKTIYAFDAYVIPNIYNSGGMSRYTKNSIALHWYAGHPLAEKYINEVTHLNYNNYKNVLCKTIAKVYK